MAKYAAAVDQGTTRNESFARPRLMQFGRGELDGRIRREWLIGLAEIVPDNPGPRRHYAARLARWAGPFVRSDAHAGSHP